ncbi:glycosyl transferase [Solitalea longa]|uniref:Glycosyl transferase n=1 Tax=Solitalea longa TaxID=2079460 RepID=A0A2S4ZZY8_9SPHI|nr:glycosyltransferase [Solitalea longa]POY35542.1 glycosyl transferase [Solitalea longa]
MKKPLLDNFNKRISLSLCTTYFRKRENGKSEWYILHFRFWQYLIPRVLIELISLLLLRKETIQPYKSCLNQSFFPLQKDQNPANPTKARIKELLLTLLGTRSFYKKENFNNINNTHFALRFVSEEKPKVSIIIPVYNQLKFTLNCLISIQENFSKKFPIELIVIDDCSTDLTQETISAIEGINYIRNEENLGFLRSCRKAALTAKGTYLCFLNNDTITLSNWLESLVKTIETDETIGIVGSKLLYPYGLLQEAGGLIFADASGSNYGRYNHPDTPKYNYQRQTDYCSGCSLLVRNTDYEKLGGFDDRYTPAYYEDTDLCFSVQYKLGKKVIYQPQSELIHFEGVSSGKQIKANNVKSYQAVNRFKFLEKWKLELEENHQKQKQLDDSARKYIKKPVLLVMDNALPAFDKESGANRIFHLLKIFLDKGYHIIYYPTKGHKTEPYYSHLHDLSIEVLYEHIGHKELHTSLKAILPYVNLVWACRPEINRKYIFIKEQFPRIKWIYDTVDLHYLRFERENELLGGNRKTARKARRYKKMELRLAEIADVTVTVTEQEKTILQEKGISTLQVVPNIHATHASSLEMGFDDRQHLLFIGGFKHRPNVDAVKWLCHEIMPKIWQQTADIKLYVVGSHPPEELLSLANERVIVTGYVPDVTPYFNQSRVFVAPLRYGAGMKGKIGQSLEYALPIVTTEIGAEGMHLTNNKEILLAHTAEEFATQTLRLYSDSNLWYQLRNNAEEAIADKSPKSVKESLKWMDYLIL